MSLSTITLRVRRLTRGLTRIFQLSPQEILTTLHALVVIMVVEPLIRFMPLPRLSQVLGCPLNLDPAVPGGVRLPLKDLPSRSSRQVRCTRRVARVWPFAEGPCLRSALVTGHLLRDLSPTLRLGLVTTSVDPHAHAWLEIDGRPLEHVAAFDTFQHTDTGDHVDLGDDGSVWRVGENEVVE